MAVWLTLVGLAATYALSVTFPGREPIFVAGALGGLLGSLSALFMNRTLSLGMVVLSPVAGALNAIGGIMIVGFLAQDQIALLGDAFAGVWSDGSASLTALAVAVLLGFSGGLFSRIAVAGTAPLLGAGPRRRRTPPRGHPRLPRGGSRQLGRRRHLGRRRDVGRRAAVPERPPRPLVRPTDRRGAGQRAPHPGTLTLRRSRTAWPLGHEP